MNTKRWEFETVIGWDSNVNDEVTVLNNLAGSPLETDFTFTHNNGTIWGGKGSPVGDVKGEGNKATIKVKFSGGGKLVKL